MTAKRFKICPSCGGHMSIATTGVCWECHKKRRYGKEKVIEAKEVSTHTHYWIADQQDIGVCKICGQTKDFGKLQREYYEAKKKRGNRKGIKGKVE